VLGPYVLLPGRVARRRRNSPRLWKERRCPVRKERAGAQGVAGRRLGNPSFAHRFPEDLLDCTVIEMVPPALAGAGIGGQVQGQEDKLPAPLRGGVGILARERVGKVDSPVALLEVFPMQSFTAFKCSARTSGRDARAPRQKRLRSLAGRMPALPANHKLTLCGLPPLPPTTYKDRCGPPPSLPCRKASGGRSRKAPDAPWLIPSPPLCRPHPDPRSGSSFRGWRPGSSGRGLAGPLCLETVGTYSA
jgi:hypothetical protein